VNIWLYFFSSAGQFRTKLSGDGVSSVLMGIRQEFFPSGKAA
jgi:hypothetical protein